MSFDRLQYLMQWVSTFLASGDWRFTRMQDYSGVAIHEIFKVAEAVAKGVCSVYVSVLSKRCIRRVLNKFCEIYRVIHGLCKKI